MIQYRPTLHALWHVTLHVTAVEYNLQAESQRTDCHHSKQTRFVEDSVICSNVAAQPR